MSPTALLAVALSSLVLAFVFALYEHALAHHSRVRLNTEARQRNKDAALDAVLLEEDEILFVSKLGKALFQLVGIATIVIYLNDVVPPGFAALAWTLGIPAFLLFNVAGPYLLGRRAGHRILLHGLLPYNRAVTLFKAPAKLIERITARLTRTRGETDPSDEIADELLSVVEEGAKEGTLAASEKQMIEGVMDLREVTAEHVMTPRTDLVCVPLDATVRQAVEKAHEHGLSRLPVYQETPDDVTGVLYVKDVLPCLANGEAPRLETLVRRPFFVPMSKNLGELLGEMKARHIHLAIVLDEYGGTAGIVTIEDILEEIVGEIEDEHEKVVKRDLVRINENAATVEGRTHIDELNDALDLDIPESEEYETIGGLLFAGMGRVPATGEHYDLDGVRFTVLEADERRINRVKVTVHRSAS